MPTNTLSLHARGEEVAGLQGNLERLGISVSLADKHLSVFGASTLSAVRQLQVSAGLSPSGVFDVSTQAALEEALQVVAYSRPHIEGRLVTENGTPAGSVRLRMLVRQPGGELPLAVDTVTDPEGFYALDYQPTPGAPSQIEIRVVNDDDAETTISGPMIEGRLHELLNLVVPSSVAPLAPEWDRLSSDVKNVTGGFSRLTTDDDDEALARAHEHTGWDARLLALAGAAEDIAGSSRLSPDAAYALVRYGLPTQATELASVPVSEIKQVFDRARKDGIVALTAAEVKAQTDVFVKFATRTRRASKPLAGVSTYGDFLEASGLDRRQQDVFDAEVVKHAGDPQGLWEAAEAAGISNEQIMVLRGQGRLAVLTSHNLPLTSKLLSFSPGNDVEPGSFKALIAAGLHRTEAWQDLLEDLSEGDEEKLKKLLPQQYILAGITPQTAADAYARDLGERLRAAAATAVVEKMIKDRDIPVEEPLAGPLAQIIARAEDRGFAFASQPLTPFLAKHRKDLVQGIQPDVATEVIAQFERLQRLYQATPSHAALAATVAAGFTSAHQIAMLNQQTFLDLHGQRFPSVAEAEATFQRSRHIAAVTYAHTGAAAHLSGPRVFALSTSPTVETLLGEQDFCECEHCRSLLGPAAYLVDLLHFLDIDESTWQAMPEAKRGVVHPFKALEKRRPDIAELPLTCENTNTELPYIDIANEIMEYRVVDETPAPVHGVGVTSADLVAEPVSILASAYDTLRDTTYPLNLPFDLWLETVRGYLNQAGLRHADLLAALHPTQAASYTASAIFTERLGMTPAETDLLTTPASLKEWHRLYGYDSVDEARRELRGSAKTLARRLGVSYVELATLVKTWFVNPGLHELGALGSIGLDAVDLMRASGAEGVAPFEDDDKAAYEAQLAAATRRFNRKGAAWKPFDAASWAVSAADQIDDVLVLAAPDNSCSFDTTTLRFAGSSDQDVDLEMVRLNVLVRLWRRLDWTVEDLDQALRFLIPLGREGLSRDRLAESMRAALDSLAEVNEIALRLGLDRRQRVDLLGLRSTMPHSGSSSTYARHFLVPHPGPTFDHPLGRYLSAAGLKLADHRSEVQGALALSATDMDHVLTAAGVDPESAPLTLETVSLLFRYQFLAAAMGISIPELIAFGRVLGLNPFESTLNVLDAQKYLQASGLLVADLEYLYAHHFDALGPFQPNPAAQLALAVEISDGLRRLEDEHAVPSDAALWGDEVIARELGLIVPPDLADTLVAMWQRQLVQVASEPGVTESALPDPELLVAYDEVTLEHHPDPASPGRFIRVLSYRGLPLPARLEAIAASIPELRPMLEVLLVQAQERRDALNWLVPDDAVDTLFGRPPAGADVDEFERARRKLFAAVVMPRVLTILQHRMTVAATGSALSAGTGNLAAGLVEDLLSDATLLPIPGDDRSAVEILTQVSATGLSVSATNATGALLDPPTTVPGPTTPEVPSAARIVLEGYLQVPTTGTYWFGLSLTGVGDTGALWLADDKAALLTATGPADRHRVPAKLRAGVLYPFSLEAHHETAGTLEPLTGTVSVDVGDLIVDGASHGTATGLTWRPQAAIAAFTSTYTLLAKAVLLAERAQLNERELRCLGLGTLSTTPSLAPPAESVRELLAYLALRSEMVGDRDELIGILTLARSRDATEEDAFAALARLIRREPTTVATMARHLGLTLTDLREVNNLRRLWDGLTLVARLDIGIETVLAAATPTPDQAVAESLRNAVRARFDVTVWRRIAASINDPLRRRRRDALVAYLLHELGLDPTRPEMLYRELLLDPGTEPVVRTSRLRLAISCVQLFIQRCLLNLEPEVKPAVIDTTRWAWMKRYRVWEANRKIFLFPENWLEPELREEKTHLFTALAGTLLEGDVNDQLAEDAFVTYLRGLADIARLEIVSIWQEPETLHVISRDYNTPHRYYYRRHVDRRWTPWEPISVQIDGDHVTAVMYRGRLHIFWITLLEKGAAEKITDDYNAQAAKPPKRPKFDLDVQLHWTELMANQWSPPTSSALGGLLRSVSLDPRPSFFLYPALNRQKSATFLDIHIYGGLQSKTFRFVSRNSPPQFRESDLDWTALRSGLAGFFFPNPTKYDAALEATSFGDVRGGFVLKERRPFTAIVPPQPPTVGEVDSRRSLSPFFYSDKSGRRRKGKQTSKEFNGQNTFFVERSLRCQAEGETGYWHLSVAEGKEIGAIVPAFAQQVRVLGTRRAFLVPIDPIDPASKLKLSEATDWATELDGVLEIGGRDIGQSGRMQLNQAGQDPNFQDREV
jgi:hypothetical protein